MSRTPQEIPFGRPSISDDDRRAVAKVLDGPILTHGPEGKAFGEDFAKVLGQGTHAIPVSSCMAALHLSYLALGIKAGDEVIVPAQTHTATVHAVELVGARPVFVDCDPATGNVTGDAVREAVTSRTRAISVVHLLGIPCDMPPIMEVAREHDLRVVEDCALALGARLDGRHVGLFGDTGCFSFYPVKHITTGDGGMFVTRDAALADRVQRIRAFGVDRTHAERSIPGMYDVTMLGLNYRMSEMQAALGRSQLAKLPSFLAHRKRAFGRLQKGLQRNAGIRVLDAPSDRFQSSHYAFGFLLAGADVAQRDAMVRRINAAGIGTSVHYPHPVPRLSYYRTKYGFDPGRWPNATTVSDTQISLPVAPHVLDADLERMEQVVPQLLEELTP